jgi:predicted nucleic acid binding AN1-type Zn finger protein
MDLLDKGIHCEEKFCHQLDYLPLKCKACSKNFCSEHIKYANHHCTESYKFNYEIPVCPLCNHTIEFQRGKDLDICLAEHIQQCELNSHMNKLQIQKSQKKKCSFNNCKSKDSLRFDCQKCHNSYCIKHRIQEDHNCQQQQHTCSQEARTRNARSVFYGVKGF